MNTKQLIAGAALALVGVAASAQTPDWQFGFITPSQPSAMTRQDAQAELVYARATQVVDPITQAYVAVQPSAPVSRAQVKAELQQARAQDTASMSNGFGFIDNNYTSTRTREEVRKEAIAATRGARSGS